MNRHSRAVARYLAQDLARDLVHDLTQARDLAYAHDFTHDRAPALARALSRARDLAHDLTHDHALAHDLAHDLALDLVRARDLAHILDLDPRAYSYREIVAALDVALGKVHELERILQAATASEDALGEGGAVPGRVQRGMIALAVRVLPVRDRPRYAEEMCVELGELPRLARWGYALRTLTSAWELRRELIEAVGTPKSEPVRRVAEW